MATWPQRTTPRTARRFDRNTYSEIMDAIETLVSSEEHLTFVTASCVKCILTGHEMKPNVEIVKRHLKSKAYRKASWYAADYSEYEPYIVAHLKDARKLYCRLTRRQLNKIPIQVKAHVNGKRFQRLKRIATERMEKQGKTFDDVVRSLHRKTQQQQQQQENEENEEENEEEEVVRSDETVSKGRDKRGRRVEAESKKERSSVATQSDETPARSPKKQRRSLLLVEE